MKKNLLLRLCLIMIALLSFHSCRQDLLPEKETYKNSSAFQLTSKRISLNESKHKAKLLPELEKAEAEFKAFSKINAQGKVVGYANGISIDTDDVIYIENGPNYHTYTFNIKRENAPADAPLENLLLVPLPDGKYKEYLVVYNLSISEKEKISAGLPVDTRGKTEITELANGTYNGSGQLARMVCTTKTDSYWASCSENKHDGSNYSECAFINKPELGTPPIFYTIITTTCLEQNYDIITPIDPGGSGGGGPGGIYTPPAGSNPPCTGTTIPTNPQPGFTDENGCPIGLPTLPNIPNPADDPCVKTKRSTTAANNLLHESNISTEVSTLEGHAANSFTEYGMAIINTGTTTIAQDPYSNNDPNNPGKVTIIVPTVGNFLATGHTHPDHGAPPPSPADFYVTLEYARDYPTFQTSLIFVYNGTKYALVVNDRAKAIAFLDNYPSSSTTIIEDSKKVFSKNSQVGKDFIEILENYMSGRLPSYSVSSHNDGLESAFAEILQRYDTGISIAKTDANGNLKSLQSVSFDYTIPASGGKKITGYRAEKCP